MKFQHKLHKLINFVVNLVLCVIILISDIIKQLVLILTCRSIYFPVAAISHHFDYKIHTFDYKIHHSKQ